MKIGEAIRKLRQERGATQEEVAIDAGTNAGNLSRIERCQQQPSLELVEQIAAALGTTVADLYAYAESIQKEVTSTKQASAPSAAVETTLFRRNFQLLTPENKRLAIDFVKLLNRLQKSADQ
jgi:transcriptional regulator with XRE-family HTH domain